MSDLKIFDTTYNDVAGFKAKDTKGNEIIYTKGINQGIIIEEIKNSSGVTWSATSSTILDVDRDYLIRDGKILNNTNIVITGVTTTVTEKTDANGDYVYMLVTGNNYGHFSIQNIDDSYDYIIMELIKINGDIGYSWKGGDFPSLSIGTGTATTGNSAGTLNKTFLGQGHNILEWCVLDMQLLHGTNSNFIKFCISGDSTANGFIGIKNLYLEKTNLKVI